MPLELTIDALHPDRHAIAVAAEALRAGRLVAFPTETVYGLGADATSAIAVERIFAAKGRSAHNPVIVHVADTAGARAVVADWPRAADKLAAAFWPGPLTLVLPRAATIPDVVTAGGPTVGVRVPAHPVAAALIRAAERPVAAPSANRSLGVSPTRPEHVRKSLGDAVDVLLAGGATSGGIESTVLDLTSLPPRLLRPGLISAEVIAGVLGLLPERAPAADDAQPLRSPGQLARHYAPRARLQIAAGEGAEEVRAACAVATRVGWLRFADGPVLADANCVTISVERDPLAYATRLYAALHELDDADVEAIIVARPPEQPPWRAIWDRLARAATGSA